MLAEFLQMLYGDGASGWLTLWTKKDKQTHWFDIETQIDQAVQAAESMAASDDVYFGVGLRGKQLSSKERGSNDDVTVIPGLWVDVDVAGAAHKAKDLPPDDYSAVVLLQNFPLKPSLLVHSGNGLHGYWLFREPWELESTEERQEAAELMERFQAAIRQLCIEKGWKLDSTHDLARILRLPGTKNYKNDPPKPVKIVHRTENRYNPTEFETYLPEIQRKTAKTEAKQSQFVPSDDSGPANLILDNCKFVQHCKANARNLPEPEWYVMVANVARAQDGPAMVHELSKPYKGYDPKETDEKIRHALERGQPHTCEYIRETIGFKCPDGGCGVTAPCGFALSKVSRARTTIAKFDMEQIELKEILSEEVIGALAVLKKEEPSEYALLKDGFRGKVNLNDLERAVNKQIAENQKLRLVQAESEQPALEEIMPTIPLKNLRIPYRWTFNENGIWMMRNTKAGPETICACMVPVILTKRLRNVDTAEEKLELSFHSDGKWHYVIADRATVGNRQGLIQLSNKGLPVNSENARFLIQFLDELERENRPNIPLVRSVSHMGWVSSNRFLPGLEGDIELDIDDSSGAASVAGGYREQGTLANWVKNIAPLREQHAIARFMLSASFAAPLLKIIGQRVFIIHNWGPSRGGKTAALKAALSVWGEPEDLIASFNATKVGLERLASFYSDLPLGIDERQVVGDRQGFVESLVYLLGLGKGKARGSRGGGLQQFNQWRTVALTTGEQPLSTSSSTAGIKTRALELYGVPIGDEALASKMHDVTRDTFGTAGPLFVQKLIELATKDQDAIKREYEELKQALGEQFADNISSHVQAVATVALADFYSSQWIFGLSQEDAAAQAIGLAEIIIGQLETAADADDGLRAYEHFISWYRINEAAFGGGGTLQKYGRIDSVDPDLLLVYPPIFETAIKEGGFNPDKILRDWADRGWIETGKQPRESNRRLRIRKRDDGRLTYFIGVRLFPLNEPSGNTGNGTGNGLDFDNNGLL